MAEREFDIVLWGATGATGRRAAHHLARRCSERGLRLAVGGRNRDRLEEVRAKLPVADDSISLAEPEDRNRAQRTVERPVAGRESLVRTDREKPPGAEPL